MDPDTGSSLLWLPTTMCDDCNEVPNDNYGRADGLPSLRSDHIYTHKHGLVLPFYIR